MKHVVIIGNGISGITAARNIRKLQPDYRITVISAETEFFFSRTALMYVYMGHMTFDDLKPYEDWFWAKNRIDLRHLFVTNIDPDEKRLHTSDGQFIEYDTLILAVGSKYNTFGWPGQDLPGVQGLVSKQDLDQLEENTREVEHAVVVGGGLIGVELTEMLHSRGIHVTFLVREASYMDYVLPPEESDMVGRHIREHGIDLRLSTELDRIVAGPDGRVQGVVTSAGDEVPCRFVGLTAGVRPNLDVVAQSSVETNRGILVDEYFKTNVPDVYAIGDCAEYRNPPPGRRSVEQLWYTGRTHGMTVARTVCGAPTPYRPGVFFNSAKFFDLEYQTYGDIAPDPSGDIETLLWEHPEEHKSIRIHYERASGRVVGFNLMGVRYRHPVCERWIAEEAHIENVLQNLGTANFDPEFFKQYEAEVVKAYNARTSGPPVKLLRKRGLFSGIFRTPFANA